MTFIYIHICIMCCYRISYSSDLHKQPNVAATQQLNGMIGFYPITSRHTYIKYLKSIHGTAANLG